MESTPMSNIVNVMGIYTIGDNLKSQLEGDYHTFSGEELVDWFLQNDEQICTRGAATQLCRYLLEYRIIHHVDDKYHFMDHAYKEYRFCIDSGIIHPRTHSERQTWVQGLEVLQLFLQDHISTRKSRNSIMQLLHLGQQTSYSFKGKALMDWLQKRTDFESRDDCRRFVKSLLKLNFIHSSSKDNRFLENTEYSFYVNDIKGENGRQRKISKSKKVEKCSIESAEVDTLRKESVVGLTSSLFLELGTHQALRDCVTQKLQLRDACEVLRGSRSSLVSSKTSQTSSGVSMKSRIRTVSENDSRDSSLSGYSSSSGFGESDNSHIALLRDQYFKLSLHRSATDISDLIRSQEFQKRLEHVGKSASHKNLKAQAADEKRAILDELNYMKYGPRTISISPSNSCPHMERGSHAASLGNIKCASSTNNSCSPRSKLRNTCSAPAATCQDNSHSASLPLPLQYQPPAPKVLVKSSREDEWRTTIQMTLIAMIGRRMMDV